MWTKIEVWTGAMPVAHPSNGFEPGENEWSPKANKKTPTLSKTVLYIHTYIPGTSSECVHVFRSAAWKTSLGVGVTALYLSLRMFLDVSLVLFWYSTGSSTGVYTQDYTKSVYWWAKGAFFPNMLFKRMFILVADVYVVHRPKSMIK